MTSTTCLSLHFDSMVFDSRSSLLISICCRMVVLDLIFNQTSIEGIILSWSYFLRNLQHLSCHGKKRDQVWIVLQTFGSNKKVGLPADHSNFLDHSLLMMIETWRLLSHISVYFCIWWYLVLQYVFFWTETKESSITQPPNILNTSAIAYSKGLSMAFMFYF